MKTGPEVMVGLSTKPSPSATEKTSMPPAVFGGSVVLHCGLGYLLLSVLLGLVLLVLPVVRLVLPQLLAWLRKGCEDGPGESTALNSHILTRKDGLHRWMLGGSQNECVQHPLLGQT